MGNTENLHFTLKLFLGNTVAQYLDVLKILEPEDIPFVGKHILSNLPHFKEKGNLVNDTGIPSIFCIVN